MSLCRGTCIYIACLPTIPSAHALSTPPNDPQHQNLWTVRGENVYSFLVSTAIRTTLMKLPGITGQVSAAKSKLSLVERRLQQCRGEKKWVRWDRSLRTLKVTVSLTRTSSSGIIQFSNSYSSFKTHFSFWEASLGPLCPLCSVPVPTCTDLPFVPSLLWRRPSISHSLRVKATHPSQSPQ